MFGLSWGEIIAMLVAAIVVIGGLVYLRRME